MFRNALTLVEVVASIALISAILVGMLMAHARHQRQIKLAKDIKLAAQLADKKLADWFLDETPIHAGGSGEFSDNVNFFWRTSPSNAQFSNRAWAAEFVEFQVFHRRDDTPLIRIHLIASDRRVTRGRTSISGRSP